MGRPKGSKNYARISEKPAPIKITEDEQRSLSDIFTSIGKDLISIDDFQQSSGLSYQVCAKLVREIKSVSDILNISGYVHRADYFIYLSRKFSVAKSNAGGGGDGEVTSDDRADRG